MKLSKYEKKTLTCSMVIGALLGIFGAYFVIAFAGEMSLQRTETPSYLQTSIEAFIVFVIALFVAVATLGVLPIAVRRARAGSKASEI